MYVSILHFYSPNKKYTNNTTTVKYVHKSLKHSVVERSPYEWFAVNAENGRTLLGVGNITQKQICVRYERPFFYVVTCEMFAFW